MKKWITIKGIGEIRIENELLYMDYPVLFVARLGRKIYLVENIDNDEGIYLASRTTYKNLLNMMTGQQDIRTTIIDSEELLYIEYDNKIDEFVYREVGAEMLSDDDLPDINTFFTLNDTNTKK